MGRTERQGPKSIPIVDKEKRSKKFPFFTVDSLVEVTSDEEGLKGAWFEAKILKSYINRKPKFLIQYKNLVSDKDSNEPLKETVDGSFIRPLPPPPAADQIYEAEDVVDAFYCDGWWKGVVSIVELRMCRGKLRRRYTVEFENPRELVNFNGDALRFHHDWIGGKWIRNPKQKVLPSGTHAEEQSADASFFVDSSTADNHAEDKSSVKKSRKNPVGDSTPSCATFTSTNLKTPAPETSPGLNRQEAGSEDGMTESSKKRKREPDAQVTGYQIPTAAGEDATNEQPFVKSLYMWNHIDALEIFRILPQKPHFSFLSDSNKETREGSAFGLMLTFASMADKVTKLQIDDPRSRFDSYVEALAMLEVIGFDVKVLADRVNELLVLKEQKEQLDNRSKRYQNSVADCDARKAKLEQEIAEIDKMTMTSDLVVQRASKVSEMVTEDSKRNLLQLKISSLKIVISDLEDRFKVKSVAPWQRVV
ncbi:DUF724 domain-containing protein 3-like [Euphorbia lathyris]|uniref:DUF724 domain-containing protein 3-like n=1 Tax=Euphorbia lathyris TaxID=212925 RepID=UPI0033140D1A